MIPVRRDSGAACVAGIYNGIADATKFFGMAHESASGSGYVWLSFAELALPRFGLMTLNLTGRNGSHSRHAAHAL
jgi:hypothetical protein